MLKDLIKDDQRVLRTLGAVGDGQVQVLLEDMKNGKLPPIEKWYWNVYEEAPCYLEGNEVYCFSYETIGDFYLLGTLEELEEEAENRLTLGFWGMERLNYLNKNSYGSVFGMLCRGNLWESCKEIEEEADEREAHMIRERMRPFESLKNRDPIEYNRIWNNEMQGVRETIREELIYV